MGLLRAAAPLVWKAAAWGGGRSPAATQPTDHALSPFPREDRKPRRPRPAGVPAVFGPEAVDGPSASAEEDKRDERIENSVT
jgi:hypothetical protein